MNNRLSTAKLVAIVGGSGAGKSWLAGKLRRLLRENAARLSLDDFYRDRSHLSPKQRERVNYDHPRAVDWRCVEQVLSDCRTGRRTRLPRYDFKTHRRMVPLACWQPKPIVLVEGLWLLRSAAIRRLFALRIFIDCPERIRLHRRLVRDVHHRGRDLESVHCQFQKTVAPMHRRFVAPQRRWANIVLRHPLGAAAADQLTDQIWGLLEAGSGCSVRRRARFKARGRVLLTSASIRP
ncbi:MAG: uridine kinase [Limisphaerales bacterium]